MPLPARPHRHAPRSRILALCALAVLAIGLAGCGGDKNTSSVTGSTAGSTQATFVLTEWKITLDGKIPAGQVNLKIDNQGGEKHELVIVAATDIPSLPRKSDGSVDEDKIPAADKVGESGDIAARSSVTKTFTFAPGAYVAFCNLVDDMGMPGSTMMNGDHGNMGMGGDHGSMNGNGNGNGTGTGTTMGHVHVAQGMAMTFTVA